MDSDDGAVDESSLFRLELKRNGTLGLISCSIQHLKVGRDSGTFPSVDFKIGKLPIDTLVLHWHVK